MYITPDSGFFPANNQSDLAVSFKAYQTINYMAPGFFKLLRPYDIVLFIKSSFQLYQYGNLLTILRRLRKRCNDRRISADTVQRLFDSQNIRIFRCLAHKIYNRIKTHIRMMEKYITLTNHLKDIFVILKLRYRCRLVSRSLINIKPLCPVYFHKHGKIQRSVDFKNICLFDVKFHLQNLQQTFIRLILYFQANHFTPLSFL